MAKDLAGTRPRRESSTLFWTARIIPLVVGCFLFITSIVRLIIWEPHPYLLLGLIPLLLALIAWRNHLAGGLSIVLLTCALLCSVSDRETIYTGLPFAIPFMVGGILHIAVWWTDKRPAHASGRRPMSGTGLSVLRRTTLVISLVPGTVLISAFLGVSLHNMGQELGQPFTYPFYLIFWGGVFLLIAGCASQSHLFGGLLCVLISAGALLWVSRPYDSATFPAWAAVPFFLTVLAGGILHLIIWWNERQGRDSWTNAPMR